MSFITDNIVVNRISETFENIRTSDTGQYVGELWTTYNKDSAFFQGLLITPICTATAAYLFKAAPIMAGTLFGVINYALIFFTLEVARKYKESDLSKYEFTGICLANGILTKAILDTVLNISLTKQAALILTIAAVVGQASRGLFIDSDAYRMRSTWSEFFSI